MRGVALFSSRRATAAAGAAAGAAAAEVVGAKALSPMAGADAPPAAAIEVSGARVLSSPHVATSSPRCVAEVGAAAAAVTGPSPLDIHRARSNHAATASSFLEALARVAGEPASYPHVRALLQSHPECVRVLQQLTMDFK